MTTSKRSLPITSTGAKLTTSVIAYGIIVNSHTNGTIALYDAATGAYNIKLGTYTFPAGSGMYTFPNPIEFENGVWAVVGGTLDAILLV